MPPDRKDLQELLEPQVRKAQRVKKELLEPQDPLVHKVNKALRG